ASRAQSRQHARGGRGVIRQERACLASLAELGYAGRGRPSVWASPQHDALRNGIVDSKRDKASDVNPPLLHKKMLQLLSSLWGTRGVGLLGGVGLAAVREDGVEASAAIAAARGLIPDRVYRLLRALSTLGIVAEPIRGRFVLTPLGRLLSSH